MIKEQPLQKIQWMKREKLKANDYNPNRVMPPELKLLKVSILEDGWTQPIVARETEKGEYEIVDGFHRWTVSANTEISKMTDGLVPVVIINKGNSDQMMSTIRHNRARGAHVVTNMGHIINDMMDEHNLSEKEIMNRLGMEKEEVNRLYDYGKMTKRGSNKESFSSGWVPKHKRSKY
jgi:ParB/RepB/Spo0J family partition protein